MRLSSVSKEGRTWQGEVMEPSHDALLTRPEAAARAGVTLQTIRLWERAGRLRATRVRLAGQYHYLIRVSDLDQATDRSRRALDPTLIWRPEELEPAEPEIAVDPEPHNQPY
jgi:excisionase family DNA binding protein